MANEMSVGQAFERYYADWLVQAEQHLASLRKALERHDSDQEISLLVETCCKLYHDLARARIRVADEDPSYVSGGRWQTSYISGLLWLGGYRPTTATVLLFSLMGAQVKEFLPNLAAGREFQGDLLKLLDDVDVPALASLSNSQIKKVDALQRDLRDREDKIDRSFALEQMNVADQPLARATLAEPPPSESFDLSGIRDAIAPKLVVLRKLVAQAEGLRSRALREIIDILSPVQAGQYTVATFEFAIALRKLGQQPQPPGASSIARASSSDASEELQALASQGDVDMLCNALQRGLKISAASFNGTTALHAAALNGQAECVKLLVERGAQVNLRDIWGVTPLVSALKEGHDEVARILGGHGAALKLEDPGLELCQAAAAGNWEYLTRLVQYGVDINSTDRAKQTVLHIVAGHGSLEAVTLLLDMGANMLARARNGNTPVDEARLWNTKGVQQYMESRLSSLEQPAPASASSSAPIPAPAPVPAAPAPTPALALALDPTPPAPGPSPAPAPTPTPALAPSLAPAPAPTPAPSLAPAPAPTLAPAPAPTAALPLPRPPSRDIGACNRMENVARCHGGSGAAGKGGE